MMGEVPPLDVILTLANQRAEELAVEEWVHGPSWGDVMELAHQAGPGQTMKIYTFGVPHGT